MRSVASVLHSSVVPDSIRDPVFPVPGRLGSATEPCQFVSFAATTGRVDLDGTKDSLSSGELRQRQRLFLEKRAPLILGSEKKPSGRNVRDHLAVPEHTAAVQEHLLDPLRRSRRILQG